ncbi:MAG: hypothetical protein J6W86_08775 [Bacteroidales bacterium]|nr:hypothetical protein [Bacteroidales bacterium]
MTAQKNKILLDADVIIHFFKGGKLSMLPRILPEYQFVLLDVVKREIPLIMMLEMDRLITVDKTIAVVQFGATSGEVKEYARLTSADGLALGRGESACMVYCRYHNDVLASSNLKDVTDYCNEHNIKYLTTVDLLFYAIQHSLMSKEEALRFIKKVVSLGSRLPEVDFDLYTCDKL